MDKPNTKEIAAEVKSGVEVNIGKADRNTRDRVRYACAALGFKVVIKRVGFGYLVSKTGAI
ncbi:hypothetical protein DVA43_02495 [Leclercia sp. W6]|uniref:hypothetical protein n=1 Tax=Leclercia sp. W6 TaxID=2282310 RepID=UPI000DF38BDF|nr:hypothetical protein [Leclercia sp. W6]AXF58504.1 hypothetical protein DVA43_02495 [Leclercia sp. W6]